MINCKLKHMLQMGLVTMAFLSFGCRENEVSSPVDTDVQWQSDVGLSYLLVEVRGKEAQCLKFETISKTMKYSSRIENQIKIFPIDLDSCKHARAVKIPGTSIVRSGNRIFPYVIGLPSEWMDNEILFGSCSLDLYMGFSWPVTIQYDICDGRLITTSTVFRSEEFFLINDATNLSIAPISLTERDKKLEQLSGRAIVLYGAGIHMALGENIDLTPENERKIWQQALETARGEQ